MSPTVPDRLAAALARFDEENSRDPNRETLEGVQEPKELIYARRMSAWLERLSPGASEALRLAARAQHLCRWMIPRERYPMDRAGYRAWRSALAEFHAGRAAEILREVGYDEGTIARVGSLLRKVNLRTDPEVQALEDVACVVFLESYFAEFARKHDEEKLAGIVRRVWRKMSPRGREAALALDLPAGTRALVKRALAGS